MQFSNQTWSIEIKRKCNSKCKIHIWVPLDESPVISYADGPGPAVSNRAICLCFWPKLNDAAVGFCETTIFLYPTIKSTPLWLKLRQNDICGQRFMPDHKLWMQTVIWYSFNIYDRQMNQQYNQLWKNEMKQPTT